MEIKAIQCGLTEIKLAATDANTMEFTGYAAVFGNVDSHQDVILSGAFKQYLDDVKNNSQNYPAMLLQHGGWGATAEDMTPIGVWTDLVEDSKGLLVAGKFADTQRGIEAYKLLKMTPRPAINGLSIGYIARETVEPRQNSKIRELKRIDLVEISLVTRPSNDLARVSSVKSKDLTIRHAENALCDAGFSKKEAKTILAKGYKNSFNVCDAEKELKQLADLFEQGIKTLTN